MKYLKYVVVSIMAIFCVPNMVKAEKIKVYNNYELGDEVIVNLNTTGSVQGKFYVISDNNSDNTVTALYSTTIGEPVAYGRYSEINPIGSLPNTTDYATSIVKRELEEKYMAELGWTTPKQIRLFSSDDMQRLQEGVGTAAAPTTLLKYPWLMSRNHYWVDYPLQNNTSSSRIPIAATIGETNMIAYLEMTNTAYIRPVIVISKDYVVDGYVEEEKNEPQVPGDSQPDNTQDSGTTGDSQVGGTTSGSQSNVKVENPKTGVYVSFGIVISGMVAGIAYFVTKKKKYFKKI